MDDSEEIVRRCRTKAVKASGKIHKNAFYFGHPEISVDRSKYRTYRETLSDLKKGEDINKWTLIKALARSARAAPAVLEVKADPAFANPAHALVICEPEPGKKQVAAEGLAAAFEEALSPAFHKIKDG